MYFFGVPMIRIIGALWEFPKIGGVPFWGLYYSILGSILGSPYFGKLLYLESLGSTRFAGFRVHFVLGFIGFIGLGV